MKKISAKNLAIGMLVLSNLAMAALLYARRPGARGSFIAALKGIEDANPALPPPRKAVVHEANLSHNNDLQECYETFLSRNPVVEEGVVEMHWRLEKNGHISALQLVRTELNDQTLMDCMMDRLNTMNFHPPAAPQLISHKFTFRRRTPSSVSFR